MTKRFTKSRRLRLPNEFLAVKKGGVRVREGILVLGFLPGGRRRLGIVASRNVGCAVERNRLKRVVREFFRINGALFPEGDCVVIPGRGAASLENEELRDLLRRSLEKLNKRLVKKP
ncbi:MAG TPA: ribonuclease P protein component [bacterium]|nr:ribonuclease P protein component [bacterium]